MWEGNREDGEKDTNDRHLQARFSSHSVHVYLLARLLHLEHPAGTVVVVGVAVVLHVGGVLHCTVLYCTVLYCTCRLGVYCLMVTQYTDPGGHLHAEHRQTSTQLSRA